MTELKLDRRGRRARRRSVAAAIGVATVMAVIAPGTAAAAEGFAPAGCASDGHLYSGISVCVSPLTGRGRADAYGFRHLTGTATVVYTQEYGCWSSVTTSTGSATSFDVFGDHTASAQFAMTGETVQPAWVQTDPETGDMICGETVTTPISPWELSIGWWQDPDQPGMDMLCNSVAPCGERVPQSEVYRRGA